MPSYCPYREWPSRPAVCLICQSIDRGERRPPIFDTDKRIVETELESSARLLQLLQVALVMLGFVVILSVLTLMACVVTLEVVVKRVVGQRPPVQEQQAAERAPSKD